MLTEQQIRDMEPGRELDRLVATLIMKFSIYHYDKDVEEKCYYMLVDDELDPVAPWESYNYRNGERRTEEEAWNDCPKYSSDISAAWEVVIKLQSNGMFTTVHALQNEEFMAVITTSDDPFASFCEVTSTNVAEAICKAALIAHMRGGSGE